jgi:hypothetical protein
MADKNSTTLHAVGVRSMSTSNLEVIAYTLNNLDQGLPKGRSRCFDIGIWGGCGACCPAFVDGECGEPQEIDRAGVIDEHGEEKAKEIFELYPCFSAEGSAA